MGARWFLVGNRYFSISVKVEWPNYEMPIEPFIGFILDIPIRPLLIIHIVSLWTGPFRCLRFAFLCTSMPDFEFHSDILETDEDCVYPAPGYPGALDLLLTIWAECVFECRARAIWITGHIRFHAYRFYVGIGQVGRMIYSQLPNRLTHFCWVSGNTARYILSGTILTIQMILGQSATG